MALGRFLINPGCGLHFIRALYVTVRDGHLKTPFHPSDCHAVSQNFLNYAEVFLGATGVPWKICVCPAGVLLKRRCPPVG